MTLGFFIDFVFSLVYFNASNLLKLNIYKKSPRLKNFKYGLVNLIYRTRSLDSTAIMENVIFKIYTRRWFKFRPNQTYIDIGGHIGTFSVPTCLASPMSVCYAYEPAKDTYRLLNENIKLNGLQKNIKPHNFAVSSDKQSKVLNRHQVNPGSNSLTQGGKSFHNIEKVRCTTLNDIFKDDNITKCNLLKIDCEGSEYDILRSTSPEIFKKIDSICMEFHLGERKINDMKKLLQSHGFKVWSLPDKNILLKPFFGLPLIFADKIS